MLTGVGVLAESVPVAVGVVGWAVGGFGIGFAYPSVGALVLSQAPPGEEGLVSAALQLAETVGVAVFAGIGGALIAVGLDQGWDAATALALVFAAGAATALAGLAAGRRVMARDGMSRRRRPARPAAESAAATAVSTISGTTSTSAAGSSGTWVNGERSSSHPGSESSGPR